MTSREKEKFLPTQMVGKINGMSQIPDPSPLVETLKSYVDDPSIIR
jgi:hypothetical protein